MAKPGLSRLAAGIAAGIQALCLALLLALAGAVAAQPVEEQQAYFEAWQATAARAETAIDAGRASNAALEDLRAEIVAFRQGFVDARDQNSARIATLQSQLAALGPPPGEGAEEPADIAALRASLNDQMKKLQVPVIVSQEAYNRANGLIAEIDRIFRERQTRRLLSRGETPLNPVHWARAVSDLAGLVHDIANETARSWRRARELHTIRNNAPLILLFLVAGSVLLVRGRRWAENAGNRMRGLRGTGTGVWRFIVSLGRIGLPLIGLFLLTRAVNLSEVVGLRGTTFMNVLPLWGVIILGFMWLGDRVCPKQDQDMLIPLPAPARAAARRTLLLAAVLLVLSRAVALIETVQNISESSQAVLMFPIIVAASMVLLRLRQVALVPIGAQEGPEQSSGLRRLGPAMALMALVAGTVAPLLAAAGYQTLAEAIIFPSLLTLALFGLIVVLQKFISDFYAWASGMGEAAAESVFPALVGFILAFASLPLLALIWGARTADLTELWVRFLEGFSIGETRISPVDFLTFAIVFALGYAVTRAVQGALKGSLLPRTRMDTGGQHAVVSGTGYLGIFLSALIAITAAGIDLSSLAIVAGALSVGIGFGLQNIVSNFVSGIILLIERPISEGDWIEVNGQMGYVRDISVRSTRIETFDRTDVIVPNADLVSGLVTNYTRGNTVGRVIVPVGVAYGTDTKKVDGILREIANAHPMVLANPEPNVVFQGFGADSLDFEIRAILRDVNWVLTVKSDMNHEIAKRFAEEGIEIPFAQRDIWLRNPEVLRQAHLDPAAGEDDSEGTTEDAPEGGDADG